MSHHMSDMHLHPAKDNGSNSPNRKLQISTKFPYFESVVESKNTAMGTTVDKSDKIKVPKTLEEILN